jgi:phosphocarrier protein
MTEDTGIIRVPNQRLEGFMKEVKYVITNALGIHARPAGFLVKAAARYKSDIQVGNAEKMANAKRIVGVMALNLKQNQELIMTFDGEDEEDAAVFFTAFLKDNF